MTDLLEMPLAASKALRAAVDFLARMPEVEESIARAAERAQSVLDQVLERVRPIENDLFELNKSAAALERRLAKSNTDLEALSELTSQLVAVAARLEGAAEHLLDRVPGLSSEKAIDRAEQVIEATSGGIDGN